MGCCLPTHGSNAGDPAPNHSPLMPSAHSESPSTCPLGPTRRASSSVHHRSSSRQHGLAGWLVALVDCRSMPARLVWTPSVFPQCCPASRLSCPRSDAYIKLCLLPPPTLSPLSLPDHARLGGLQFFNISSTAAEILRQSWRPSTKSLPAFTMSITTTTRPISTMSFT